MEIEAIKEILKLVNRSALDEVEIERNDFKIKIKKKATTESVVYSTLPVQQAAPIVPAPAPTPLLEAKPVKQVVTADSEEKPASPSNTIEVRSPMIGTFYRAANPESAPFVQVGDIISQGQVLCIVEAMKLFNEIESEVEGKIVKILVDNATPVEYDTPLFLVEPA